MASEWARKKASDLIGSSFVEHDELCGRIGSSPEECDCGVEDLQGGIAAALDEAAERGRKEALGEAVPLKQLISEALAEAREEGAQRERWACYEAVKDALEQIPDEAALLDGLNAISARGPMLEPEEGSRG